MKPGQVSRQAQGLFKGQRRWRDGAPHGAALRKDREKGVSGIASSRVARGVGRGLSRVDRDRLTSPTTSPLTNDGFNAAPMQ